MYQPSAKPEVFRKFSKLPFPPELELGMILDGYKIVADVQASSRSQVYRVRDKETSKQYIMKTPSVNYEDDTGLLGTLCHGVLDWEAH